MFQEDDGGNVEFVNGTVTTEDGLATSAYLSLFGGNEDDEGLAGDTSKQWWGNVEEADETRRYRSETQALLRSMPLVPANLRRAEDAAVRDLAWMQTVLGASVAARATMPALNVLGLQIAIELNGSIYRFTFNN